jgi:hypothetical protein
MLVLYRGRWRIRHTVGAFAKNAGPAVVLP